MHKVLSYFNRVYSLFLSETTRSRFERFIFFIAIIAYVIHFSLILLVHFDWLPASFVGSDRNQNILSAIYTPFSIILIYEIYLLIYYLPSSITSYLGRQYEVIALIFIRKLFDDLANFVGGNDFFIGFGELKSLSISFIGLIVLLLLIFLFYYINGRNKVRKGEMDCKTKKEKVFVISKKVLALVLMTCFIVLFLHSFSEIRNSDISINTIVYSIKKTNESFFNNFFALLIISEVLLLIFTLNLTEQFSKIIRNSGFIISTILLKLSFMTEDVYNIIIINIAVAFGVVMVAIHKLYVKKLG